MGYREYFRIANASGCSRCSTGRRCECDKSIDGGGVSGRSIYDGSHCPRDAKIKSAGAETEQQETAYVTGYRDLYSSCATICDHLPKNSLKKKSLKMYIVSCSVRQYKCSMAQKRACVMSTTTTIPRRHSLRIPAQPPPIPIPPSLRESPYLNASLFKYDLSLPRSPSDEDERWLQDTVPLTQGGTNTKGTVDRRGSIVRRSWPSSPDGAGIPPPPLSPPIIHRRATPTTRLDRVVQTRSESQLTSAPTHHY